MLGPDWWGTDISALPLHLLGYILLGLGVVLAARLALGWCRRLAESTRPLRLFIAVSGQMGLRPAERWRLWRIARRRGLTSPLTLLLSHGTLSFHAERYLEGLSARAARHKRPQLEAIRGRLFG